MSHSNASPSRVPQIDLLRAAAILLVLGAHSPLSPEQAGFLSPLARVLCVFGWTGVDLFFVLSGFLVGGLLFREFQITGRIAAGRFLIRRAFKILPLYFLYVAFVGVLKAGLDRNIGPGETIRMLLPNLLQVQNYFGTARAHTWSLAVEEHFYLCLPLVLLALSRWRGGRLSAVPLVAVILSALCLGMRMAVSVAVPLFRYGTHVYPTHLRIDALFFGVLLAYWFHCRPAALQPLMRWRGMLFFAGLTAVSPMAFLPLTSGFVITVGFTLLYLGYGAILVSVLPEGLTAQTASPHLVSRVFTKIGVFSYGIYLWHIDLAKWPVQRLAESAFLSQAPVELRWILLMAGYVILACFVGALLSACVEYPALALRDRLFPSIRGTHLRAGLRSPASPLAQTLADATDSAALQNSAL